MNDWDTPHRFRRVDHNTASRNGEPYAAVIERKQFLPNPVMRFCTAHLKVKPMQAYARHVLGWKRWHSVIGLRFDEPRRVEKNF